MTDPTTAIHLVALADIADDALPRDRTGLDARPLEELRTSIAAGGLRMPVELFEIPADRRHLHPGHRYGIISGFRRVAAFRAQHEATRQERYAAIPAFLRAPADNAAALAAMVEENEIRADISPWERGHVLVLARDTGTFPTIDAALEGLYPHADRMKKTRLRGLATAYEHLDGVLTSPETLSLRQVLRLAAACNKGFTELVIITLDESRDKDPAAQWRLLQPVLAEAEQTEDPDATGTPVSTSYNRGRPRRVVRLRNSLIVRREKTQDGYVLRFTGKQATSSLLDEVLDNIEQLYGT